MRARGERVKGKRTKEKPKCKIYIFCEGTTEEIHLLDGCKKEGLYNIFSNPCFEVWFVLHFGGAPYGKTATQMKHYLKELLKEKCPNYSETVDIYDLLFPMQKDAIKRAKALHKSQKEVHKTVYSHECNPYTDIFCFIDHMEKIKRENLHLGK